MIRKLGGKRRVPDVSIHIRRRPSRFTPGYLLSLLRLAAERWEAINESLRPSSDSTQRASGDTRIAFNLKNLDFPSPMDDMIRRSLPRFVEN